MSKEELALGIGRTPEFIERALNDPGILLLPDLEALAKLFGVQFTDLLEYRNL
jgi:Cro/C1-type helix-turn-helix DNA-binding protein